MSPHTRRRALLFTLLSCTLSVALGAVGLTLYHRQVIAPQQRLGLVDLAEVYRLKEAEFTQRLTQARGEEDRQAALLGAQRFASRLPQALNELPQHCSCLVLLRQGVVGSPHSLDLTPLLQQLLESP